MGAFLPVSRGRRALALTGVALLFTTIFMLSSRSEGYRPNIDSAWLTSNIPLSIGNLAAHVPEEVYTAQRNKALAARVVDKEQFSQLEVVLWEEGIHDGASALNAVISQNVKRSEASYRADRTDIATRTRL